MAQDPDADLGAELARRIRSHLPTTGSVEEKRMFGGLAFVDPPGWEADESLSRWIEEALAFVATLPKR